MPLFPDHYPHDAIHFQVDTTGIGKSIKMTFSTNVAGDIDYGRVAIEPMVDPIAFKRTPNTIDVDKEILEKYVGKYDLFGTEVKIYIKDENVLYAFVPGQPEYELVATAAHKFNLKVLDGYKVEFLESDGSFNEVKFIQPNGTFVAKRKEE